MAAVGCSVLICLSTLLAAPLPARAAGDNGWQVVSGRYDPSHKTSEGIASGQLGNYGFIESSDGGVRVNKTVEPAGVEDEFIMRLSVDTCAVSGQVVDYGAFFQKAPYKGLTSNSVHGTPLGAVVNSIGGSGFQISVDSNSNFKKSAYMTIKDPSGGVLVDDIKVSWGKGNNVTFYLKIDDKHYVLMGVSVNENTHNTLQLSKEAWDLINEKIAGEMVRAPAPSLNSVTDIMGGNIEYLGPVNTDGGTSSFDGGSTLTWNPQYSPSCIVVEEDPVFKVETNASGAVVRRVMTQKTWYYGAASFTYKVRLKAGDSLASSYNPADVTNPYFTNSEATLDYTSSTFDENANKLVTSNGAIDFPKPEVKGITYDLRALKWNADDDAPLAGATFKLTRAWTDSNGAAHNDLVSDSLKSDEDGLVAVTGLPWGTYTLEETAAPAGFVLPQDTVRTFSLSYTDDSDGLTASTISPAGEHRAMSASEAARIDNERMRTDVSLRKVDADDSSKPIAGAKFSLYKDNGDGVFIEEGDELLFGNLETDENGALTFPKLIMGTYFLKETQTPSGYQINNEVYRIQVLAAPGQTDGASENMILVGKADGAEMRAPETSNTITVADKAVPSLPSTGAPGIVGLMLAGGCLFAAGTGVVTGAGVATHDPRLPK